MKHESERLLFDKDQERESIFNIHDAKMDSMLENSQAIIKKIKEMSKEIKSDLQSQNKYLHEIGISLSKTDLQLRKNNSKIDEFLSRRSTCSLIFLTIAQIIAIICLIVFL